MSNSGKKEIEPASDDNNSGKMNYRCCFVFIAIK
jgi:hypothetical protein